MRPLPRADTLKKGSECKVHKGQNRSRHIIEARVLNCKHVNEGLGKLLETEVGCRRGGSPETPLKINRGLISSGIICIRLGLST